MFTMKRIIWFLVTIIVGQCNVFAYHFSAVAPSGQTLYYSIVTGEVTVVYPGNTSSPMLYNYLNFTRPTGDLIIPDSVCHGGIIYPVTSIGDFAFYGCSGLTSVTIPKNVTSIGGFAFQECYGLTTINFNAKNCTSIGRYINGYSLSYHAFGGCPNITNVHFGDSVIYITPQLFLGFTNIDSITIPNSVTIIGDSAFMACTGLTSLTIGDSVTIIGNYAFSGCSGLDTVTIGNSVTTIGTGAFMFCVSLTSLTIPRSVATILAGAFGGCSGVRSITMKYYPPVAEYGAFSDIPVNIPVNVPCHAVASYYSAANWSNFTHFVEGCATITVTANDFTLGGVTGGGEYSAGDTVTLTAIPYSGSHFIGWSNGSQTNPLVFVATTNASYIAAFAADNLPPDTVFVHDTTYIFYTIHDTIIQNIHDTVINIIHDTIFINNYIHDTLFYPVYIHDTTFVDHIVYDTVYFHDTIYRDRYIHDTVYIHDTIYIQEGEGIGNIALLNAKIYQRNGQIVVEGAEGYPVYLYDVVGRLLATRRETAQEVLLDVPASGAYLVKIGDAPARRVVVRR